MDPILSEVRLFDLSKPKPISNFRTTANQSIEETNSLSVNDEGFKTMYKQMIQKVKSNNEKSLRTSTQSPLSSILSPK